MDFSITSLFVVPVGNTLPTAGSTEDLTAGQFGVFKDKTRTVATAGNVGAGSFIQVAQGRPGSGLGSKRSDKINSARILRWEKVSGHGTAVNEVWEVGSFSVPLGTDIIFSVRLHSNLIDARFANGLLESVSVNTGCLTCGADPCSTLANEAVIDKIIATINQRINNQSSAANAVKLNTYLTFEKIGTGSSAVIRITGKPVESIPFNVADLASRNVDKDRLWFRPFAYQAPDTAVDFISPSTCTTVGTTTLIQKSSFVTGTSEEVKMMETDYYSYQASQKSLFRNSGFNGQFVSWVTDAQVYDLYYIRYMELLAGEDTLAFSTRFGITQDVILAIPQGSTAAIEAILVAYLGAVTDETGTALTSTTSTSTSSTTTTSTTQIFP